ncbi:MAG: winged helix-turn-helix transcriptional regulator [Candidatus Aenigmatarchaeota archaeon]
MRKFLLFALTFFLISFRISFAQVQYYGFESYIEDKRSYNRITITFSEPKDEFIFAIKGRVENLVAKTLGESIECEEKFSGITLISCKLNLTKERRTIEISFETEDFIKDMDGKFIFTADLSLGDNISSVFVSVKLPEGMALINEEIPGRISFPESSSILSDGRHIIVTWKMDEIIKSQPLIFQIIYEPISKQAFSISISYLVSFGAIIFLISFLIFYFFYLKKPKELVLSVLDDFEKRVLNCIIEAGGEVKQKKIVNETNLSKAKVSRIVKSLEKRGLIEIKRLGRSNLLKLVKKKLEL